jgi:hypothetical protein
MENLTLSATRTNSNLTLVAQHAWDLPVLTVGLVSAAGPRS